MLVYELLLQFWVIFSRMPHTNCIKLQGGCVLEYNLMLAISDEQFHCSKRKRLEAPSHLIRLDRLSCLGFSENFHLGWLSKSRFLEKILCHSFHVQNISENHFIWAVWNSYFFSNLKWHVHYWQNQHTQKINSIDKTHHKTSCYFLIKLM